MASIQERIAVTGRPIFLVGGVILCALFWFMNGSPTEKLDNENNALESKIKMTEQKIKEAENRLTNKPKLQEEMDKLSQIFRLALEYLPKDFEVHDILRKISLEARAAGVEVSAFSPQESTSKDFYEENALDIRLRGPYSQLVTFLANVSKLPRIINVKGVELTSPKFVDGVPVMEFKGIFVVYRYKEGK
jgi:type IV pilus assembly protein PilO